MVAKEVLEGLRVFGFEDGLRAAGLATASMLDRQRRRPADTQQPAARYWTGHEYALLWNYEETVSKAPLSPAQQARWDANRTCARCDARQEDPYPKGPDGLRYCEPCQEPAALAWWEQERAADRPGLTAWATEVLADPRTVLVGMRQLQYRVQIVAVDVNGQPVFESHVLYPGLDEMVARTIPAEVAARAVEVEQVAAALRDLQGRRFISWWRSSSLDYALRDLGARAGQARWSALGLDLAVFDSAEDDWFGQRWSRWLGQLAGTARFHPTLRTVPPPHEPAEIVKAIKAGLCEMAAA